MRVVVVGGGISGTAAASSAAHRSAALGRPVEVILLERDDVLGGKARSLREGEWLFEAGPLGYIEGESAVDELVRRAGLESARIAASSAQSHRFVHSRGRVREVKAAPLGFATSGLLSFSGLLRAACEPFVPRKADDADESVWDFAARRLGPELAERLIHPMVLGVFAGDAKRLSLPAAFPIMAELEKEHGSLVRAQIARARARRRGELSPRRSTLFSFVDGMQSLPKALAARGEFAVRTSAVVEAVLPRESGGFRVAVANEPPVEADAVIVACEGYRAAEILESCAPETAKELAGIPHPPIYVAALGYGLEARRRIPEGFGVLLPRTAGYRALGATWDGYLFPGRNAPEGLLLRVLFGGSFDPEVDRLEPEEILAIAERETAALFGLRESPRFRSARRWERAIPQYELGHRERVDRVDAALGRLPGLYLAGNALHGTSFGKAAARGALCGAKAVESLAAGGRR